MNASQRSSSYRRLKTPQNRFRYLFLLRMLLKISLKTFARIQAIGSGNQHVIERSNAIEDIEIILKKVLSLKVLHLRADDLQPIDGQSDKIGKCCPLLEHFSLINDFTTLITNIKNLCHLEVRFPAREGSGKTEMLQEKLILSDAINLFRNGLQVFSTVITVEPYQATAIR